MRKEPNEGDPGRQPNPLLVGIVLPFYLAWTGLRAVGRGAWSLMVAAGRGLQRIIGSIETVIAVLGARLAALLAAFGRAIGAVLRVVDAGISVVLRTLGPPIRVAVEALGRGMATVWRAIRVVLILLKPLIDRLGVAFAIALRVAGRTLASILREAWRATAPLRDLLVWLLRHVAVGLSAIAAAVDRRIRPVVVQVIAIVSVAIRLVVAAGCAIARQLQRVFIALGRFAAVIVVAVRRSARWLGQPIMALARVASAAIRAAGAAITWIGGSTRSGLVRIGRRIAAALRPVTSAVRQAGIALRPAFAPVSRAIAAVRDAMAAARNTARAAFGLAPRPVASARASSRAGRRMQAHPRIDDVEPARDRRADLAAVALSVGVVMFLASVAAEVLAIPGSGDDLVLVVGGAILAGLIAPVTRAGDATIGFAAGTAAVVPVASGIDALIGRINPNPPFFGWLALMIVGLFPFILGCLAGSWLRRRRRNARPVSSDRGPTALA